MSLQPNDFPQFFRAVHGHHPFPWQQRLVFRLAETNRWPEVLDLPTGSGKTAAMDAALFHLALRAETPGLAAIRIVFVVDRRIVVDEAHRRARKVEGALKKAAVPESDPVDPVVREVALRLGRLAGEDAPPLLAVRLRGGAPLEHVWARSPSQPTILCSTVDQVGSRLLFRGYGVSDRMKPLHAGLLGDSLILLDEAHLSEPFRQTVNAVREVGGAKAKCVLLTATPESATATDRFELEDKDRVSPLLQSRIKTGKRSVLRVVRSETPERDFCQEAEGLMRRLLDGSPTRTPAVGVVVNRVALARAIHRKLDERFALDDRADVVLMIGRSRGVDRDRIAKKRLSPFFTGKKAKRAKHRPLFVVATQCLEVGVDLDLDGLVTQAAPLDSLRQRFGRLKRDGVRDSSGASVETPASILALKADTLKSTEDPIYGDRLRATWEWLKSHDSGRGLDFGIEAMREILKTDPSAVRALSTAVTDAPVVMPAYLDAWSSTSPIPATEPEVGLFLHGAERSGDDVSVVWRDDISTEELNERQGGESIRKRLVELMSAVPPRAAEMLPVPIAAAKRWLHRQYARAAEVGDLPHAPMGAEPETGRTPMRVFRWAGRDSSRTAIVEPRNLRPGDLIVVPAEYGGCDKYGWDPASPTPVRDVADEAAKPYRGRRHFVRLCPARCGEAWRAVRRVIVEHEGLRDLKELVRRLIESLDGVGLEEPTDAERARDCRELLEVMRAAERVPRLLPLYGREIAADGVVLFAPRGVAGAATLETLAPTTEDRSFSGDFNQPVTLDEHGRDVERQVERSAAALDLPPGVLSDLKLAGFLHDAGKADPRFQIMLSGGNLWNAPSGDEIVFAKSVKPSSPTDRKRSDRNRSGLPEDWRHEALSVRLARSHPRFEEANDPALVLWLIGTHHGYGRPFFPSAEENPPEPPRPALEVSQWDIDAFGSGPDCPTFDYEGRDWPSLFRSLREKYGIWELARFEAIVRLADHQASAKAEGKTAS